jgi:hypothetical protein
MATILTKDPDAVLDYGLDWEPWLAGVDTIASSQWFAPVGLTIESDAHTDTTATVWLSEGVRGAQYLVTNRITTASGRTEDRSFVLQIADR